MHVHPHLHPTSCPRARLRRRSEHGLTLIEMLVTISIMTLAIVGIAGGVAATQRIAGITQDQAQLEVAMRQLSDFVRDSTPTSGLTYQDCAQASTYNAHLPAKPGGVASWSVATVYRSTAGSRTSGTTVNSLPHMVCSGTCPGATCIGDWGVQEIQLTVTSSSRTLTRLVWKSKAW